MEHPYLEHYQIGKGHTLLDLGATQGDFMLEILPQLRQTGSWILNVEPELRNFQCLEATTKLVGGDIAKALHALCGYKTGMGAVVVTDQALLHHSVHVEKQFWDYKTIEIAEVPMYTLDTLVSQCGGSIDFVKCDIEGGEIDAFMGAEWNPRTIDSFAIAAYHVVNGERTWKKLAPFFESLGYEVDVKSYPELLDRDMVYAWRK